MIIISEEIKIRAKTRLNLRVRVSYTYTEFYADPVERGQLAWVSSQQRHTQRIEDDFGLHISE